MQIFLLPRWAAEPVAPSMAKDQSTGNPLFPQSKPDSPHPVGPRFSVFRENAE
jgi:hypothetical protein